MSEEETQKVLEELHEVRPEKLNGQAKRLYEAIMNIADERDKYIEKNKELEKQMGKDLDVVYLQGVYNERDRWEDKIKAKIEEYKKAKDKFDFASVMYDKVNLVVYVLQELLEEK